MNSNDKNYKVGYKHPPKEYQFKPGQSGNPKGRPKVEKKDFYTDLVEELQKPITITENGERKTLTRQQALIKQLVSSALSGNSVALQKLLISLMSKIPKQIMDLEEFSMSDTDIEIIMNYLLENNKGEKNNDRK